MRAHRDAGLERHDALALLLGQRLAASRPGQRHTLPAPRFCRGRRGGAGGGDGGCRTARAGRARGATCTVPWRGWHGAACASRPAWAKIPVISLSRRQEGAHLEVEGRGGPGQHRLAVLPRADGPLAKGIAVGGGAQGHAAPPARERVACGRAGGRVGAAGVPDRGGWRCCEGPRVERRAAACTAVYPSSLAPLLPGCPPAPAVVGEEAVGGAVGLAHQLKAVGGARYGPVGGGGGARARQGCGAGGRGREWGSGEVSDGVGKGQGAGQRRAVARRPPGRRARRASVGVAGYRAPPAPM